MKLEKKHWAMLITGVVVLFLVYWFFFRKKVTESAYNPYVPIWGIGMGSPSESGYSADQLDPMGVESGYDFGRSFRAPRFTPAPSGKAMPTTPAKGVDGHAMKWCCAAYNTSNVCDHWEKRETDAPCGGLTA